MPKILRITTVPISLNILLKGQLRFMREKGFEVVTASANGNEVSQIVEREVVTHHQIDFTRTLSPFRDLKALFQLIKLIKKERPEIVHTHTPKAGLLGMMASWFCKVPIRMHTVAGMPLMEATGLSRTILNFTERITYYCAHKVYPNSFHLLKYMEAHFPHFSNKYKVLAKGSSNGINTNHFNRTALGNHDLNALRSQLEIPEGAVVASFVGRMVHDKGIHELIDAFTEIEQNDFHLVLVGPYEDQREPLEQAYKEEIKANPRIHHVGFQKDIRPYLAISDFFVFPSYREGFPNVVMQAAAMDLPCIVTDINGSNEIIEDGNNGLIVPVKNAVLLKVAMEKLISDDSFRKVMASNARQSIVENYQQETVWNAILKEYQQLLSNGIR
ncbi:glycosyltransferase family 4 protein [Marivirga atlantica]|jgi:glycosyltransferase involved in cell wall biosynthesis|uniref:Glycosyltransferase family 4 protein n=1 Tax=Marivirga atlantica TaxID=1548457 RepID=A0A937AHS0_9BACT|nr:glycosyltransferase family 4 protein [Marivirga atlantica]MBL0766433.1 glycosyltransferase family 4 protein [Marivirga atlantica]